MSSSSVKHVLMNCFKTFSNFKYVCNLNLTFGNQKKTNFDFFIGVRELRTTVIMTDIIKTEKNSEIKTEPDHLANINLSVMGSHNNERVPAAENLAEEITREVLPVKVEQPFTSEDLEKLSVKKEDSQEDDTRIVNNPEVLTFKIL